MSCEFQSQLVPGDRDSLFRNKLQEADGTTAFSYRLVRGLA